MTITSYVGAPSDEVSIQINDLDDLIEAVDVLHTMTMDYIDCPETDAILSILSDCLTRLENLR